MGRAGSGGSSHHSSGGHSSHRSSGGHRVSSSRAVSSSRYTSYSSSSSHYGGSSYGRYSRTYYGGSSGGSPAVFVVFVMIVIAVIVVNTLMSSGSSTKSTIQREPLTGTTFINHCIVDEIGWFDNVPGTERELKEFWEKTGVQPYIVLHNYDPSLTTDALKEEWAQGYYDKNIEDEDTFLFVYFAEENVDDDVGYMAYVNGKRVSSVMDAEAVEIFWGYIDKYWYSDMSTDDMFTTAFNKTAKTIMRVSTTWLDVAVVLVIVLGAVTLVIILFVWWRSKVKRDAAKAKETERILNTPIDKLGTDDSALTEKYDTQEVDYGTYHQ